MRTPAVRKGASHFGLQEAEQALREERRVAALLIERIGNPEMRRAFEHRWTRVVAGLLQRLEKGFGLRAVINDVVRRAPREEECRRIVLRRDVRDRRGVEVDAPVVEQARAEEALDDMVARP